VLRYDISGIRSDVTLTSPHFAAAQTGVARDELRLGLTRALRFEVLEAAQPLSESAFVAPRADLDLDRPGGGRSSIRASREPSSRRSRPRSGHGTGR
jgi:hypothetical protein